MKKVRYGGQPLTADPWSRHQSGSARVSVVVSNYGLGSCVAIIMLNTTNKIVIVQEVLAITDDP